jgi:hypothetical protein
MLRGLEEAQAIHMKQPAQWINDRQCATSGALASGRLPFLKFLQRYPIFILAFGPPLFRPLSGVDATKGVIDAWSFVQVGLLVPIAIRAMYRLASAQQVFIPKQIRSILRLAFLLGFLFLASAIYSPSHMVSAAYAVFYFLTLISIVEFAVDVYKFPPEWMQCLIHLRFIALLLFGLVLVALVIAPSYVLNSTEGMGGIGIRFHGGSVASVPVICPTIAIISAYCLLYRLEPRGRSVLLFLVGLAGTLSAQARGPELALLLCLAVLAVGWAKRSRRFAYAFISISMALILFLGPALAAIGGGRIWNMFNRGQSAEGIASASGRTEIWKFVVQYCMVHPQGMGYVAGFRQIFRTYFSLQSQTILSRLGNAHNSFMQVLADAGWLALAIYLIMMFKIVVMGRGFLRKRIAPTLTQEDSPRLAIRCALLLLFFCFANGLDTADFVVPLRGAFYLQNLIIAIIFGISARMHLASSSEFVASP